MHPIKSKVASLKIIYINWLFSVAEKMSRANIGGDGEGGPVKGNKMEN